MSKILIATGNLGKLAEIKQVLADLPIELLGSADLNLSNDVVENGNTYQENALIKARYFYGKSGGIMPVLADDSGLIVDALKGELGVFTRRWGAGEKVSDAEWLDYFMEKMSGVENRGACFVSYAVLLFGTNDYQVFSGEVLGEITKKIEAPIKIGIPLSSVFKPNGYEMVYSAMSLQEKMKNSHRGIAMAKARDYLKGIKV